MQTHDYLVNLCLYIHANPVKDGLVSVPEHWEFSNDQEWMGLRDGTLVNRAFIAENFGSPAEYQGMISRYIKTRSTSDDFREHGREFEA